MYGEVTTGAESDLEQVTRIARQMVGRWGMSDDVGLVSVLPGPQDEPLLFPGVAQASERTQELVDNEVRRIVDELYSTSSAAHRLAGTLSAPMKTLSFFHATATSSRSHG